MEGSGIFCPRCGSESGGELRFCRRCGTNLEVVSKAISLPASADEDLAEAHRAFRLRLVRGIGLDNSYRVRFDRGRIPPTELRLPVGTRDRPSYVRLRKPGCYAFQIDGLTFSRSIVFRAAVSRY